MCKTVLITGASRGIGKETAILFAKSGYNVIINYLNSESSAVALCKQLSLYKIKSIAIKANVSDSTQVRKMVETAKNEFGKIDVLENNAGIAQQKLFTDISEQDWDQMFNINIKGMYNCCKEVVPLMVHEKNGKIINVSSIWGITGASCEVHYSASKAAVIGFTKALAKELGPSNINVNCVAPGIIDTDMNNCIDEKTLDILKDETPLGTIGTCNDIAQTILFLASNNASFITGQVISPNGGFII